MHNYIRIKYSYNYSREYCSSEHTIYKVAHSEYLTYRLTPVRLNHIEWFASVKIFLRILSFREVLNITYYTLLHTMAHYNNCT